MKEPNKDTKPRSKLRGNDELDRSPELTISLIYPYLIEMS